MDFEKIEHATKAVMNQYQYGCEDKKYHITFYTNISEREERIGCTKTILGVIENFNPNQQTAIRDANNDLWLIESRLISVMKPMSEFELKRFEEETK